MSEILKADFSNARVSDRVKCLVNGEGNISSIDGEQDYPILVAFSDTKAECYDTDGCAPYSRNDTLFYHFEGQFPTIEACTRPLPKIEVDEKVLVWICEEDDSIKGPIKQHFASFHKDRTMCVWANDSTSWAGNGYKFGGIKYWKLASDPTINSDNLDEIEK